MNYNYLDFSSAFMEQVLEKFIASPMYDSLIKKIINGLETEYNKMIKMPEFKLTECEHNKRAAKLLSTSPLDYSQPLYSYVLFHSESIIPMTDKLDELLNSSVPTNKSWLFYWMPNYSYLTCSFILFPALSTSYPDIKFYTMTDCTGAICIVSNAEEIEDEPTGPTTKLDENTTIYTSLEDYYMGKLDETWGFGSFFNDYIDMVIVDDPKIEKLLEIKDLTALTLDD